MRTIITIAAAVLAFAGDAVAQTSSTAQPAEATRAAPAANPADVATVDGIIAALYDVISGPAGQARDWDRFRSLYLPGANMGALTTGRDGQKRVRMFTPDQFVETNAAAFERQGFHEVELGRRVDRWGPLIRVMSGYDGRRKLDDPEPLTRGVNLIQLVDDGQRLWISSIFWTEETAEAPIPADLAAAP